MSVIIALECNQCGEQAEKRHYVPFDGSYPTMPDTWFTICVGDIRNQEPHHFCGAPCLQRYLSENYGPTIDEKIQAWEAAHPEVDCTNAIIHPYYADALRQSMKRAFGSFFTNEQKEEE